MAHRHHRPVRWILLSAVVAGLAVAGLWGYLRAIKFETLTIAGRVSTTSALQSLTAGDPETAIRSLGAIGLEVGTIQLGIGAAQLAAFLEEQQR